MRERIGDARDGDLDRFWRRHEVGRLGEDVLSRLSVHVDRDVVKPLEACLLDNVPHLAARNGNRVILADVKGAALVFEVAIGGELQHRIDARSARMRRPVP